MWQSTVLALKLLLVQTGAADLKQLDVVIGAGAEARAGDLVTVEYTGNLLSGQVFDSSVGKAPLTFQLGAGQVIKGWDQGVLGMKVGGRRFLSIPPNLAYGDRELGDIPPNSTLVFDVKVLRVAKKDDKAVLEIEELAPGEGNAAKSGDTVEVHYTGMFLNGTKFDSSHDRKTPLTIKLGAGQVIKGFDEGVTGMKVGGKRKITIPPALGYGERQRGPIPPNSTLVFELELVSIKTP